MPFETCSEITRFKIMMVCSSVSEETYYVDAVSYIFLDNLQKDETGEE